MPKSVRLLMLPVVALCWLPAAAFAEPDGLVGEWILAINSPRGVQNPRLVVEQSGATLNGVYHSRRGPLPIEAIEFDGSNFSFPLVIEVPIGKIEVNYRGRISGDEMQGLVQNPRGEVPFSGKRN